MAKAHYSPLDPDNPQLPCSLTASLQASESGDAEHSNLLAKPLPALRNGYSELSTEPGAGTTIDEDKLRTDPDDGPVIDW